MFSNDRECFFIAIVRLAGAFFLDDAGQPAEKPFIKFSATNDEDNAAFQHLLGHYTKPPTGKYFDSLPP